MFIKRIILSVYEFIKKVYFLLFKFIIGSQTKKIPRFFTHLVTMGTFVLSPIYYYGTIPQLFEVENASASQHIMNIVLVLLLPAVNVCVFKIAMLFKW